MKILKSFTDAGKFVYAGNGMVPHEELSTNSELDFFVISEGTKKKIDFL